jgi:hypothetical protein
VLLLLLLLLLLSSRRRLSAKWIRTVVATATSLGELL